MANFNLLGAQHTRTQAFHLMGKNVHHSSPQHGKKTFLKTTEHSWTKTRLSRVHTCRRKLFTPVLMNKLIRFE